ALAALALGGVPQGASCAPERTVFSLDQCISIAQKSNPDIAIAGEGYRKAESGLLMNYGTMLPGFTVDFSTGHRFYGPSSVEFDASGRPVQSDGFDYPSYAFDITSNITVFDGGGNINRVRSAMSSRDAARESLKYRRDVIAGEVIRSYYGLVRDKMLLRVQEESSESAKKNLERTEALLQAGSATRADVLKARVRFSNTRLAEIQAKNAVEVAKQDLSVLLKMDNGESMDVDTTITIEFKEIDVNSEMEHAMAYRSDIKSLEYNIKSADAGVAAARSGWFPSLGVNFGYTWNDRKMAKNLNFFDTEYTWGVAGYISLNVFDRFQTSANVGNAKADARIAEYNLDKAKLEATRQIKTLVLTINEARERMSVATETVEQANEDLRLAEERYRVGAGTMLETIDAQVALTQAKSDVIRAKCDFLIATADLAVATGKRIYG
ncbi:MAG: TolC family protein, partial [Candidatus Krumholzibacteriaceae bacterium]